MKPPTKDRAHPGRPPAGSTQPVEGRPGPGAAPLTGPLVAVPLEVLDRIVDDLFRVSLGLHTAGRDPGRRGSAGAPVEETLDRVIGLIRRTVLDRAHPGPPARAVAQGAVRRAR